VDVDMEADVEMAVDVDMVEDPVTAKIITA